jgi:hypothetical protein
MVREVDQAALVEGQTSREQVLLCLGEPDEFQDGGAVFIYCWTVSRGFWAGAGGAGGDINRTHLLRLEFDASGRLVRLNRQAAFGSRTGPLLDRAQDQGFRVALRVQAEGSAPAGTAPSLQLGPVEDLRLDKVRIGTRASFGQQMADIYPEQDPVQHLGALLANEARTAGFQPGEAGATAHLHLRLNRFWVHTTNTLLYWDVFAEIDCDVVVDQARPEAAPLVRSFKASRQERTYLWPSVRLCTGLMSGALEDLRGRIRADGLWTELRQRPTAGDPAVTPAPAPRSAP